MNDSRYSRQTLFRPIGEKGQGKLAASHVLIVGAGALGTSIAETLVRAGTGSLTIIDRDYVESSNLQRQQLFTEKHAADKTPKAEAIKELLQAINSGVKIDAVIGEADPAWLEERAEKEKWDLIMDATDNFETRLLINDVSQKWKIPWIYGACVGSQAISYTILPGETPCLHCLLDTLPPAGLTCDTAGIISPAVQLAAAFQSAEALKILTGNAGALRKTIFSADVWENTTAEINPAALKKKDCPSCGGRPSYPYLSMENRTKFAVLCGRDTVQIRPPRPPGKDLEEIAEALSTAVTSLKGNGFLLSFRYRSHPLILFRDGRLFIHGMKDIERAKKIYYELFT